MNFKSYDIFISYSRKDFDEVCCLIDAIKKRIPSLDCWFDMDGIESGDEFDENIIMAIDNSKYLLFAVSDNSIASKWSKMEVTYARNSGKRIIPVLLRHSTLKGWVLFHFGKIDTIDSTDRNQMDKLIKNLEKWTGKIASCQSWYLIEHKLPEKDEKLTMWNWGAAGFGFLWALSYKIYWPVLCLIPYILMKKYVCELSSLCVWFVVNLILAVKGSRWAYRKSSLHYKDFIEGQRRWNIWSYLFLSVVDVIILILLLGEYERQIGGLPIGSYRILSWSRKIRYVLF